MVLCISLKKKKIIDILFHLLQALEGLGESQVEQSQDLSLSRAEFSDGAVLSENKEKRFLGSNTGSLEDLTTAENFSLQDEEWISPPEYTFTSSLESSTSSVDESLSEISNSTEKVQDNIDFGGDDKCVSITDTDGVENACIVRSESESVKDAVSTSISPISVPSDPSESLQSLLLPEVVEKEKPEEAKLLDISDLCSSKVIKEYGHSHVEPSSFLDPLSRNTRGKESCHNFLLLYNHYVVFIFYTFF